MTRLVVDASVAAKWFLKGRGESHADKALAILRASCDGQLSFHQPPHFTAEVAAVLSRVKPREAMDDLADLLQLEFRIHDASEIYLRACDLAVRLDHHLFDTLYHGLALSLPATELVTADEAYYRKARKHGHIRLLRDFPAH